MPFHTLITHYQQHIDRKLDDINQLVSRMNQARQDMACYSYKLAELDHSIDLLKENTNPWSALDRVSSVKHQLTESMTEFHSGQARMSRLQERVSLHNLFLKGSRQRYEQIKARFRNHVWYPWFYSVLTCMVVIFF
ncbi:uncharacterized protein B0P05DRAFT_210273 [Gilbertella persicaria]|uniref:uncharacterized protein n=1 Tax=Gilbertella persicaria TaxID=101096 RepID=UPI00221E52F2|nr:uncharacterized protein B0P05DRAFT_210273 [Gilbertella persicaria]KAI8066253.1 hypothetical protein B0P05DRAFT_210273 [Gilbertella persicaria]